MTQIAGGEDERALIDSHLAAARLLAADGRLDEARQRWLLGLAVSPEDAALEFRVATAMHECKLLDEAIALYRRALLALTDSGALHNNLGVALRAKGLQGEALDEFKKACALAPNDVDLLTNLANAHKALGQFGPAVAAYRGALALRPHLDAHVNLGNLLQKLGQFDLAEAEYVAALKLDPLCAMVESNLLFLRCHQNEISPDKLLDQHKAFGRRYKHLEAPWHPPSASEAVPARKVRVGFVSGDLRHHPVAALLEPVWTSLASDSRFLLYAYHSHPNEDDVSRRFRALVPHWRNVAWVDDDELVRLVRNDRIDILIDLSGHTAMNRLMAFAQKPAPIQLSWLGYPFTTGLAAMDYFVCDGQWIPAGTLETRFVEKLIRLPVAATFQPSALAPGVNALPMLTNGYVSFASFNRISKVNELTLRGWLDVLRACPDSRLLVGALLDASMARDISRHFVDNGVSPTRIGFASRREMSSYLGLHGLVDVLLDSWPYGGGTTTLHGAWMGCPTLTMAGETPQSRQSAAIMWHLGLDEFVAVDSEGFIDNARRICADPGRLSAIRQGLRTRIQRSQICQPGTLAEAFSTALLMVWNHWLTGHQPKHFHIESNDKHHQGF